MLSPCEVQIVVQSLLINYLINKEAPFHFSLDVSGLVQFIHILEEMFCSDEKYLQFQVDGNLQYQCPMCRGECYQVCCINVYLLI